MDGTTNQWKGRESNPLAKLQEPTRNYQISECALHFPRFRSSGIAAVGFIQELSPMQRC